MTPNSTQVFYRRPKRILGSELQDGRLAAYGITWISDTPLEDTIREIWPSGDILLTDGKNIVVAAANRNRDLSAREDIAVLVATRGCTDAVLEAMERVFETRFYSGSEPQFYGFDYEEEWLAHEQAVRAKLCEHRCAKLLQLATSDIDAAQFGRNVRRKAQIAKTFLSTRPELVGPESRQDFLGLVDRIFGVERCRAFMQSVSTPLEEGLWPIRERREDFLELFDMNEEPFRGAFVKRGGSDSVSH